MRILYHLRHYWPIYLAIVAISIIAIVAWGGLFVKTDDGKWQIAAFTAITAIIGIMYGIQKQKLDVTTQNGLQKVFEYYNAKFERLPDY